MRQAGNSLWAMATGVRLDKNMFRPYTEKLFDEIYKSPFKRVVDFETGEQVINYLLGGGE